MIEKSLLITFVLFLILLIISPVSADENYTLSVQELNNELSYHDNITLDHDYCQNGEEQIIINKSLSIDGNGHHIKSNSSKKLFYLNSTKKLDIYFENITFMNVNSLFSTNNNSNIIFQDCKFIDDDNTISPFSKNLEAYKNTTGNISFLVKNLAKLIVGNSKELKAAKKLAFWVAENIKHERKAGLYQSPDETLIRGYGNCLTTTDLFLQMCEAIGLNKNHKLCYVHVGTVNFGERHFFAMIDNFCIDVDAKKSNPWGYCSMSQGPVLKIVEYPYLPLLRNY